ncbi:polysaccharide biosynthesis domain containing protein 1 [Rhizophlyctis rosea]|uniref:Polysaccharide biosynthesis domain containing protein 1 n=1 Tax=Rhizophlyctis rosea TaxID=64517 RepID=A0AAD5S253_9FUNG|nr:polysaccharide biosynthesis domain containing protein 1 [Rhizophlyctis rosea]
MSVAGITAATADNHPDIEKQWAVKALHHAETYIKLLKAVDPSKLKLTRVDEDLYKAFRASWPDLNIESLDLEEFKEEKSKAKWRDFSKECVFTQWETQVNDHNFGTLLRIRSAEDYEEDNTFFAIRLQFYAIEIARNREGANTAFHNSPASS